MIDDSSERDVAGVLIARERLPALEWPTLLLIVIAYGGWLVVTRAYGHWPLYFVAPVAVVLLTLHSSLQHEILHGHPTRWAGVNRLLAIVPLSLWLPYVRYQHFHLKHHHDDRLTDPIDDPESFYWTPEDWARLGALPRAMLRLEQTLAGRLVIGSFWRIGIFLRHELVALRGNEPGLRSIWFEHLLWCIPVVASVKLACGMPLRI